MSTASDAILLGLTTWVSVQTSGVRPARVAGYKTGVFGISKGTAGIGFGKLGSALGIGVLFSPFRANIGAGIRTTQLMQSVATAGAYLFKLVGASGFELPKVGTSSTLVGVLSSAALINGTLASATIGSGIKTAKAFTSDSLSWLTTTFFRASGIKTAKVASYSLGASLNAFKATIANTIKVPRIRSSANIFSTGVSGLQITSPIVGPFVGTSGFKLVKSFTSSMQLVYVTSIKTSGFKQLKFSGASILNISTVSLFLLFKGLKTPRIGYSSTAFNNSHLPGIGLLSQAAQTNIIGSSIAVGQKVRDTAIHIGGQLAIRFWS